VHKMSKLWTIYCSDVSIVVIRGSEFCVTTTCSVWRHRWSFHSLSGGWISGSRYTSFNAKGSIPWLFWWSNRYGGREIDVFMIESRFNRWLWHRISLRKLGGGLRLASSELAPLVILDCDFLFWLLALFALYVVFVRLSFVVSIYNNFIDESH
jgi:hypothetical protein